MSETLRIRNRKSNFRLRWDAILTVFIALVVGIIIGMGLQFQITQTHGGLPRCTDEIADAGGMCWGEPL